MWWLIGYLGLGFALQEIVYRTMIDLDSDLAYSAVVAAVLVSNDCHPRDTWDHHDSDRWPRAVCRTGARISIRASAEGNHELIPLKMRQIVQRIVGQLPGHQ